MREKDLAMIENDFSDRMVLIILVSILIIATLTWLWCLVKAENDNQQLYRVTSSTIHGTLVLRAGITFAEAVALKDALIANDPDGFYSICSDTFAS
jgi:hypothetical protein